MHNADIPVRHVTPGIFLLLGYDPLLEAGLATRMFCEPVEVIAVHPGRDFDEEEFSTSGGVVVKAIGFDQPSGREISVELRGRAGERVLVRYPDDRHLVEGVNLPGDPISSPRPDFLPRLVWADGWRIEYGG